MPTPNYAWPYFELTDEPNFPAQSKAQLDAIDATVAANAGRPSMFLGYIRTPRVMGSSAIVGVPWDSRTPVGSVSPVSQSTNGEVFTVLEDGVYEVFCQLTLNVASGTVGGMHNRLYYNGALNDYTEVSNGKDGTRTTAQYRDTIYMNVGTTVEFRCYHNSGITRTLETDLRTNKCSIIRISG